LFGLSSRGRNQWIVARSAWHLAPRTYTRVSNIAMVISACTASPSLYTPKLLVDNIYQAPLAGELIVDELEFEAPGIDGATVPEAPCRRLGTCPMHST